MVISILKKFLPLAKLTKFDKYVFVGPHPDDIEISSGGTVAALTSMGKKVVFVVATDGCVGSVDQSITTEKLVQTRKTEAIASAKLLGVEDVRFLPYHDGCGYDMLDMTKSLAKIFVELQPDVVFCPDHKAKNECHPDHLNVGKATTDAYFLCQWKKLTERQGIEGTANPKAIAYYYTDTPNTYVKVTKTLKTKFLAIRCHKSQFDEQGFEALEMYNKLSTFRHGNKIFAKNAEAFRTLTNVQQHCFPEITKY